ncbi:hypothetical protein TNCV_4517911 [Trichonephila clavipes]|nr:hypothetical protein TNCV_4517911 [Trichonephila clavipes]
MTSITNWSDRTDQPDPPQTTPTSLGVSPSRIIAGDDHIAEFSDLFREAIQARNCRGRSKTPFPHSAPASADVDKTYVIFKAYCRLRSSKLNFPRSRALGSIAITPIEKSEVIADSLQEQFEPNHVVGRELFDQRIHDEVNNFINIPTRVQEIEPTTQRKSYLTYRDSSPGNPRT